MTRRRRADHHPPSAGRWLAAVAIAALSATAARAQIYGGAADAAGTVVLSNFASDATPDLVVPAEPAPAPAAAPSPAPPPGAGARRSGHEPPEDLAALIRRVAREQRVSESLLKAVVAAESGFDARAVSPKGARGLMQLMPDTAKRWGVADTFAIDQNLRGGASYLRWLLDLFGDDVQLALAGYNAGEGAVLRAGRRIPDITETRHYVPRVLAYEAHYAGRR